LPTSVSGNFKCLRTPSRIGKSSKSPSEGEIPCSFFREAGNFETLTSNSRRSRIELTVTDSDQSDLFSNSIPRVFFIYFSAKRISRSVGTNSTAVESTDEPPFENAKWNYHLCFTSPRKLHRKVVLQSEY